MSWQWFGFPTTYVHECPFTEVMLAWPSQKQKQNSMKKSGCSWFFVSVFSSVTLLPPPPPHPPGNLVPHPFSLWTGSQARPLPSPLRLCQLSTQLTVRAVIKKIKILKIKKKATLTANLSEMVGKSQLCWWVQAGWVGSSLFQINNVPVPPFHFFQSNTGP